MNEDLDRDLRGTFEASVEARERVTRAALEGGAVPGRAGRLMLPLLAAVAVILALASLRDETPREPAPPRYRISNENAVLAVVSPSGDARLTSATARPSDREGGIIIHVEESR